MKFVQFRYCWDWGTCPIYEMWEFCCSGVVIINKLVNAFRSKQSVTNTIEGCFPGVFIRRGSSTVSSKSSVQVRTWGPLRVYPKWKFILNGPISDLQHFETWTIPMWMFLVSTFPLPYMECHVLQKSGKVNWLFHLIRVHAMGVSVPRGVDTLGMLEIWGFTLLQSVVLTCPSAELK